MISSIIHYVATMYMGNLPLINIILSIIPFLGSKVAIPYTTNLDAWGTTTLQPLQAFLFSTLGNIGLIIILGLLFNPIAKLIKKSRLYLSIATKKKKHSMPALEKATIIAIIKSIPLVGSYLSVFIGSFYLGIWHNILANVVGAIACSMISVLIGINNSCRIIVLIVFLLEMLAIAIITIIHALRNTPPYGRKKKSTYSQKA